VHECKDLRPLSELIVR